jgi:hypothetical protein
MPRTLPTSCARRARGDPSQEPGIRRSGRQLEGRRPASRFAPTALSPGISLPLQPMIGGPRRSGEDRARRSVEFRAVVVKELGEWAWRAAGDLLEGVGRVVVLAGEDRPLARDEQLSRPGRDPRAGEPR